MTEQPHIAVTGVGVAHGSPDQCQVLISINHMAESAADALTMCGDLAAKAIAAINETDVAHKEVRTTGLSVQDFFDHERQKVTADIGSYQMDVTVRPIDGAGGILSALAAAVGDALQVRGIQLGVADPEPLQRAARRLAVQDAKKRATELTEEAGLQLGAILTIQDESVGASPLVARMIPMAMARSAMNVPIEAGDVSAVSHVTLIYAIAT